MKRALVVEDYKSLSEIYKTTFTYFSYSPDTASTAEEALKKLQKNKYDVLLLDLLLQEMSGIELLRQIDSRKNYPSMKIYIVTNMTNQELMNEAMSLGASRYFIKASHTPKEIIETIINEG